VGIYAGFPRYSSENLPPQHFPSNIFSDISPDNFSPDIPPQTISPKCQLIVTADGLLVFISPYSSGMKVNGCLKEQENMAKDRQ